MFASVHSLSPEEMSQIQDFLLIGYWAFESLTLRDYNDMICGVCGVAPMLEISRRHTNNVLELKNVEVTHTRKTKHCRNNISGAIKLLHAALSLCSSSGLSLQCQMKCTWMTFGWPWRLRQLSRLPSLWTFPSPEWMLQLLHPSSPRWWGAVLLSTQRRTRSCHQHHSSQVHFNCLSAAVFEGIAQILWTEFSTFYA